jgi:hypothetical protein
MGLGHITSVASDVHVGQRQCRAAHGADFVAMLRLGLLATAIVAFLAPRESAAQITPEREPRAVIEVGLAFNNSLTERQASAGPTFGVEVTPIEDRLEFEAGVTPLFRKHSTEVGLDVLAKKPWTLSDRNEFMLGIGPEWVRTSVAGFQSNSLALEVAPDLMFWASKAHRFGWYLEPSYEYKLGAGHEHSVSIAGGFLIGIP